MELPNSTIQENVFENFENKHFGGVFQILVNSELIFNNDVILRSNKADTGGVMYSHSFTTVHFKNTATIVNNKAFGSSGGVLSNCDSTDTVTFDKTVNISFNSVEPSINTTAIGGAIDNWGIITFNSNAIINSNFIKSSVNSCFGGAIYNGDEMLFNSYATINSNSIESSAAAGNGGAIDNDGTIDFKESVTMNYNKIKSELTDVTSSDALCPKGGAIRNANIITFDKNAIFEENSVVGKIFGDKDNSVWCDGGAIYNSTGAIMTFKDGAIFKNNSVVAYKDNGVNYYANGGAIYNQQGTINLTAKTNNVLFEGNTVNDISETRSNGIYNGVGTINLWASDNAKIIFNDRINGSNGTININKTNEDGNPTTGIIELNANMEEDRDNVNLYNGVVKIGSHSEIGTWFNNASSVFVGKATIEMINNAIQSHNFNNLSIENKLYLTIDVDLQNETADTMVATNFTKTPTDKTIQIKKFNLLNDSTNQSTTVTFTSSSDLFNEIYLDDVEIVSNDYEYDVVYNDNGTFTFFQGVKKHLTPGIDIERIGGYIMQSNIVNQAFTSMEQQKIVDSEQNNKILTLEDGFWIKPFGLQETVHVEGADIDTKSYGTLAGVDLEVGNKELVNVYVGVASSQEKLNDIKSDQLGYVVGASFMYIEDNWYAGITANIGTNTATIKENSVEDTVDMTMYSFGIKAAYDFTLNEMLSLEPGISVWYGATDSKEYQSKRKGTNVYSDNWVNSEAKPQIRLKFNLEKEWLPYLYCGYVFNLGDTSGKASNSLDEFGKENYIEYGAGVNKKIINILDGYVQILGRSGARDGVGANAGIKLMFDPFKIYLQNKKLKKENKIKTESEIKKEVEQIQEQEKIKKEELYKAKEEDKLKQKILEMQARKKAEQERIAKEKAEKERIAREKAKAQENKRKAAAIAVNKINLKNSIKFSPVFVENTSKITPECQWEIEQLVEKLNNDLKLSLIVEIKGNDSELINKRAQTIALIFVNDYKIKNKMKINKVQQSNVTKISTNVNKI